MRPLLCCVLMATLCGVEAWDVRHWVETGTVPAGCRADAGPWIVLDGRLRHQRTGTEYVLRCPAPSTWATVLIDELNEAVAVR